ncbi:MAG TPA: PhzF family phenazine biosynthesis protein [Solirubrobacteraceae bacterium]
MRAYVIVDVFTDVALEGNPVAVFTDATGLDAATMQQTARELNLSETVFVLGPEDGADARVRIFTPTIEMPFAGHPVLGTAFVLGERGGLTEVRLLTGAGPVKISLSRDGERIVHGEMEQPLPTWEDFAGQDELLAALRVTSSALPVEVYDNGPRHTFVALGSEAEVAAVRPDLAALAAVGEIGVSCFAVGTDGQVKTRMFGPGMGVDEDPATGSAAGPLAVHLARHGRTAFGQRLDIRQGEEIGRPSRLEAVAEGSAEHLERVRVGGGAVIVARGEYRLD